MEFFIIFLHIPQKMVAIVTVSSIEINGIAIVADPNSEIISVSPIVSLLSVVENGGSANGGNPLAISPVS